jgi:hypothetical protein
MLVDHISKYTWHNQIMTCVKRKLAHSMSTRDVNSYVTLGELLREFHHQEMFKSLEVPKDEGPKSLLVVDLRYPSILFDC